jgi:YD repeat-containing protein
MKKHLIIIRLSLILFFLINLTQFADSQSLDQISPVNDGITTVDYYQGIAQISIPVWNIQAKNFSIPIILHYATQGITASQLSSHVGLGWSLQAEGFVSRNIKDLPDDIYNVTGDEKKIGWLYSQVGAHVQVFCSDIYSGNSATLVKSFPDDDTPDSEPCRSELIANLMGQNGIQSDMEPDIYSFNLCGISGSFVFDENGNPTLLDTRNIKIQKVCNETTHEISSFTITDENGNKYICNIPETTTTATQVQTFTSPYYPDNSNPILSKLYKGGNSPDMQYLMIPGNSTNAFNTPLDHISNFKSLTEITNLTDPVNSQYTSSWMLSKIELFNQSEIRFYYYDDAEKFHPDQDLFYTINRCSEFNGSKNVYVKTISNGSLTPDAFIATRPLRRIETDYEHIDFYRKQIREDLYVPTNVPEINKPKLLNYIKIETNDDHVKRTFSFSYTQYESPKLNCYDLGTNNKNVRYQLTSIQELNEEVGTIKPPMQFSYIGTAFPSRYTYAQDCWGFYNGKNTNDDLFPTVYVYPDVSSGSSSRFRLFPIDLNGISGGITKSSITNFTLEGNDKNPSVQYAEIGSLNKITYPTGGYQEFFYDNHQIFDTLSFSNIPGNKFISEIKGPGLRLKKRIISTGGNNAQQYIEEYFYYGGRLISMPAFGYFDPSYWNEGICHEDNVNYDSIYYDVNYIRTSHCISSFSDGMVGYDKVVVKISDDQTPANYQYGRTELNFYNEGSYGQTSSSDGYFERTKVNGILSYNDVIGYEGGFYAFTNTSNLDLPYDAFPYPDNTNYNWARGQLKSVKQISKNGFPVSSVSYANTVNKNGTDEKDVFGIKFSTLNNNLNLPCNCDLCLSEPMFVYGKYKIRAKIASVPQTMTSQSYNLNGNPGSSSTMQYSYNSYGLVNKVEKTTPDGTKYITRTNYVMDCLAGEYIPGTLDVASEALFALKNSNIITRPIETIHLIKKPGDLYERVTDGVLTTYKVFTNSLSQAMVMSHQSYILTTSDPIDFENPNSNTSFYFSKVNSTNGGSSYNFSKDDRYRLISTVDKVDDKGNTIQFHNNNNISFSTIWNLNGTYPLAEISNADIEETSYNSFEDNSFMGWDARGEIIEGDNPYSGKRVLRVKNNGNNNGYGPSKIFQIIPTLPKTGYKASVWVKGPPDAYLNIEIQSVGNSQVRMLNPSTVPGTENQWHLLEVELTKAQIEAIWNQPDKAIKVLVGNDNWLSYAYFDDLKVYPSDARMSTRTYDNKGQITTISTSNDITTWTQYDGFGRPTITRDQDFNIRARNEYVDGNIADFTWSPVTATPVNTNILFTPSYRLGSNYLIDFGEGTPVSTTSFSTFSKSYTTTGPKTIVLTVTAGGVQYTQTHSITVN